MDALSSDIQEEAPWCMLFADDIVLVGEDGLEVQSRLEEWRRKLENVGLKISRSKTEHMFCDFGGLSGFAAIDLVGVTLPVCSDFKYLGSLVQCDGDIDRDVKNRISTGWMKWRQTDTSPTRLMFISEGAAGRLTAICGPRFHVAANELNKLRADFWLDFFLEGAARGQAVMCNPRLHAITVEEDQLPK
ncbi:uncharacterized protein LOC133517487 [Cydia pomonella]|uniref:uncharacterized protein LOC133517487 n=1 Tax=Cydia pomonella TaxID=82600 RepID=UPI002ADDAC2D|nr:uncharacterized protein LOC133517487 [Cydia pomonella]